ncbi:MAG: TRIC cation channel family protein [Xanthomonadales bacterium]|nr:TRIC cation channel family protein [Xanthomonadales bacterium]
MCATAGATAQSEEPLLLGWYDWEPYQFEKIQGTERVLTGLDIELVRAIAAGADLELEYENRGFEEILDGLRNGTIDLTVAYERADRSEYAHHSFPYRIQTEVMLVRRGEAAAFPTESLSALINGIQDRKTRIGTVEGFAYGPEDFAAFLEDPENSEFIVQSENDREGLQRLIDGEVDAHVTDRMVGTMIAWRNGWLDQIEEVPIIINQEQLFVLFSRASTTEEQLTAFNDSLVRLRDSGMLDRISRQYLQPILIAMTTESNWFLIIDILGTIAFAISGVILAYTERYSIFGALVLASLPAVGGGIVRDLLTGRDPVGFVRTPVYALLIFGTVMIGYVIMAAKNLLSSKIKEFNEQRAQRLQTIGAYVVEFFDCLGLASFTITGVAVAVSTRVDPLWIWGPVLAALTGAGGGILRDVVRGNVEHSALKESFYPEVAFVWGFILSMYLEFTGAELTAGALYYAVVLTMIGAFVTRMMAIFFGWKAPSYSLRRRTAETG